MRVPTPPARYGGAAEALFALARQAGAAAAAVPVDLTPQMCGHAGRVCRFNALEGQQHCQAHLPCAGVDGDGPCGQLAGDCTRFHQEMASACPLS